MIDLREMRIHRWNAPNERWTTQGDLAEAVGCSRANIVSIEQGKTKPSPQLAQRIAEELGFDWKEFFE